MMMVEDMSGELGPREVATAITELKKMGEQNRNLKKTVKAFLALTILMSCTIQLITIDPNNEPVLFLGLLAFDMALALGFWVTLGRDQESGFGASNEAIKKRRSSF